MSDNAEPSLFVAVFEGDAVAALIVLAMCSASTLENSSATTS